MNDFDSYSLTYPIETSRARHVRYCARSTRSRPRSCRSCNAAKTKCSFGAPCSRCTKRGIDCAYDESLAVINSELSTSSTLSPDEVLPFENIAPTQSQWLPEVAVAPWSKQDQQMLPWSAWIHRGVSLSVVTDNPVVSANSNLLSILRKDRPHAQHNADLVIQALRSFPTMMLRKETFPWFIHIHTHLLFKSKGSGLPEALSNCMSIAQLFASRTPETKNFLWRTIRAEYHGFMERVGTLIYHWI
jgi:hypothetical protein